MGSKQDARGHGSKAHMEHTNAQDSTCRQGRHVGEVPHLEAHAGLVVPLLAELALRPVLTRVAAAGLFEVGGRNPRAASGRGAHVKTAVRGVANRQWR